MSTYKKPVRHGFVLIEALIALLLIGVGLLAISKLQLLSVSGAGEARSRSEAVTLSQKKLEELRNILVRSGFTGTPMIDGTTSVPGTNATYALAWSLSGVPAAGALEQRVLNLRTTWTDSRNVAQQLDLNSIIAWDDPGLQQKANKGVGVSLISPTGDAQRATGNFNTTGLTANSDGSFIKDVGDKRYLLKANGDALLFVPSKDSQMQSFTTISGKIYFDQNAPNNSIPNASNLKVRLSSEGECIYSAASLSGNIDNGTNRYKSFNYTCYVGPGWYGNVGVLVDDSVNGAAGDPTICVGDPKFNNGLNDNTLISANSVVSATRSYRGFKGTAGSYVSTGMKGATYYGTPPSGQTSSGAPKPAAYPAYYGTIAANAPTNYFNQDFLVTNISGQQTCATKMMGDADGNVFKQNAGKYFCIAPDNDLLAADVCPSIWPNFENQVGSGNGLILTILSSGSGSGMVTSAPAGIDCGSTCLASFAPSTSVTLTAVPANGSAFAGWSGAGCSGTGVCTVTLSAATTVTATFNTTATFALTVSRNGTAPTGTVTSSPAGITCGATCSFSYGSGTLVTLTAAPPQGGTFAGWSGAVCSGTGACTVTMSQAQAVTATFDTAPAYSLTVTKAGAGSGSVSSAPSGISSCTTSCTATFTVGTSVTLTATPASGGSTFTGWTGACTGTGSCTVTVNSALSVTATFAPPVVNYSLQVAKAGAGTGTVTSSPNGISCGTGANCISSFASGTSITLTATPSTNNTKVGWSWPGCTGTTCTVPLTGNSVVTATFGDCNTTVSGSAVNSAGRVNVANSDGTCKMQGGNSVGYDCAITVPFGKSVVLTNTDLTGQTSTYSWPRTVLANCASQIINFPTGP